MNCQSPEIQEPAITAQSTPSQLTQAPETEGTSAALVTAVALAAVASTAPAAAASLITTVRPNAMDAWRFLTQATFGPQPTDVATNSTLMAKGYQAWLDEQFNKVPTESTFDRTINLNGAYPIHDGFGMAPVELGKSSSSFNDVGMVTSAIWDQFLTGEDQLRQRIAFALSEIFVVSFRGADLGERVLEIANYHDILVNGAFDSLRTLIENICKSSAMGHYLTHMRNKRPLHLLSANPSRRAEENDRRWSNLKTMSRIPDQNFARELLQLFTLGQVMLSDGGVPQKDASQKEVPAFHPTNDVRLLSFVFTGWAYHSEGPDATYVNGLGETIPDRGFDNGAFIRNTSPDTWERYERKPMMAYDELNPFYKPLSSSTPKDELFFPQHASVRDFWQAYRTGPENVTSSDVPPADFSIPFLGKSFVPTGTCEGDLTAALDIIFEHQNLAPFIAKQLIQRLVTSNPSTTYVSDVAIAFRNADYSLKTLVKHVLLHPEARNTTPTKTFGKLREPVLHVTAALRALRTTKRQHDAVPSRYYCYVPVTYTTSNVYPGGLTTNLGQGPYQSPSVFNFFRPGYVEPNSTLQSSGLVAPEFQGTSASELAAFSSSLMCMVSTGGFGGALPVSDDYPRLFPLGNPDHDDQNFRYSIEIDYGSELSKLAKGNASYISSLSTRFFGGAMATSLQTKLNSVLTATMTQPTNIETRKLLRVQECLLLCLLSAQFAVQK